MGLLLCAPCLRYALAADMGIEMAQSNAAWLLEQAHLHDMSTILSDFKGAVGSAFASVSAGVVTAMRDRGLLSSHDSGASDDGVSATAAASSTLGNRGKSDSANGEQSDDPSTAAPTSPVACGDLDESTCESQALRLWRHASKQKNAEAALKVGDYAFFGKGDFKRHGVDHHLDETNEESIGNDRESGKPEEEARTSDAKSPSPRIAASRAGRAGYVAWLTSLMMTAATAPMQFSYQFFQEQQSAGLLPVAIGRRLGLAGDPSAAARHYQTAADLRHPQAVWNLGWMYQWGVGVPVRC